MLCWNCGKENDDKAFLCAHCRAALEADSTPPDYPEEIPTYLVPAILVTIFCCLPLGIPAIAFAAIASNHLASGNKAAAITASNSAKTWCGISFFCGLALIALFSVAVCSGLVPRRLF